MGTLWSELGLIQIWQQEQEWLVSEVGVDGGDVLKKLWEEKKLKKKEEMLEWQDEQLNKER